MQNSKNETTTQFGELASNLFHATIAGLFGIVTLAAALHVAISLA